MRALWNAIRGKRLYLLPYYSLLLCALQLNHMVPVRSLPGQNSLLRGLVSGFAISLTKMKTMELAFGPNLLGPVVGGMLEYSSLMYCTRSLYILAAFVYVLSLVALRSRTA